MRDVFAGSWVESSPITLCTYMAICFRREGVYPDGGWGRTLRISFQLGSRLLRRESGSLN